ncbi:hypothetical protein [Amycolatopsis sp. NPDC001319]|uniref:hypothetical protein n=1 Tax=unclassified Amycolatopsis TaxID=2618356 RepID=UPI00369927F1
MTSTLITQAARKLDCRESIAAAFVNAVLSKHRQGWKAPAIARWLVSWLDPKDPAANTEFVAWVLKNKHLEGAG